MKKMFLLLGAGLLATTMTLSAQTVRLNVDPDYDVYIDGQHYGDNATITTLADGNHTVDVYRQKGGILGIGKKRTLVNSSSFRLRNNDILIETDANGKLRINEMGNTRTRNDRDDRDFRTNRTDRDDRNDRDGDYDRTKNGKGRGYGPYNNPGKGHKYGLYKNKKDKKDKDDRDDRDDRDDKKKKDKKYGDD